MSISGIDEGSNIEEMASTLYIDCASVRMDVSPDGEPTSHEVAGQVSTAHYVPARRNRENDRGWMQKVGVRTQL